MCDFSLHHVKSRKAVVGDKLVTKNFGRGTTGFADVSDQETAVCVMPGTELAFEGNIHKDGFFYPNQDQGTATAIFRQINKERPNAHHDALEMPNGEQLLLTNVRVGSYATVLQLPAQPKSEAEAKEQERLEVVA